MLADSFDAGPMGRMITAPDGKVIEANAIFRAWVGAGSDALSGPSPFDLLRARFDHDPRWRRGFVALWSWRVRVGRTGRN